MLKPYTLQRHATNPVKAAAEMEKSAAGDEEALPIKDGHLQIVGKEENYRAILRKVVLRFIQRPELAQSVHKITLDWPPISRLTRQVIVGNCCIDVEVESGKDDGIRPPMSEFVPSQGDYAVLEGFIHTLDYPWYQKWVQQLRGGSEDAELCLLFTLATNVRTLNWAIPPFRKHNGEYPATTSEPGSNEKGQKFSGILNATANVALAVRNEALYKTLFRQVSEFNKHTTAEAAPGSMFRDLEEVSITFPSRGHMDILSTLLALPSLRKLKIDNVNMQDPMVRNTVWSARQSGVKEVILENVYYDRFHLNTFLRRFKALEIFKISFTPNIGFGKNGFWDKISEALEEQATNLVELVIANEPSEFLTSPNLDWEDIEGNLDLSKFKRLRTLEAPRAAFKANAKTQLWPENLKNKKLF